MAAGGLARPPRPWGLLVLAGMLVGAGLGLLAWMAWPYVAPSGVDEHRVIADLRHSWERPAAAVRPPSLGAAFAIVTIPRLGVSWQEPIIQGIRTQDLARGIGHYPNTALPGQIGNFAIAGHRVTHGSPFRNVLSLVPGDIVRIETRTMIYIYAMDTSPANLTVTNTAVWVLDPVPGHPRSIPTRALITLTTCSDFFHSDRRSVGFGHLIREYSKEKVT